MKAEQIREKQGQIRTEGVLRKRLKNRAIMPRTKVRRSLAQMDDALDRLGVDTTDIVSRARSQSRPRGRSTTRHGSEGADAMDIDTPKARLRSASRARSQPATDRRSDGVQDLTARTKAERQSKLGQRKMNRMARQGEADRHIGDTMPKHLVSWAWHTFMVFFVDGLLTWLSGLVCWETRYGQDVSALRGACYPQVIVTTPLTSSEVRVWREPAGDISAPFVSCSPLPPKTIVAT